MLDWGDRKINLYLKDDLEYEAYPRVDRVTQMKALLPHEAKPEGFLPDEARIRDTFDIFFGHLQRFGNFIEAGLISPKELAPYLNYWIDAIAGGEDTGTNDWRFVMLCYISYYKFLGVVSLFQAFELDISPRGAVLERWAQHAQDLGFCKDILTITEAGSLKSVAEVHIGTEVGRVA
jgi:hypothetical protein